MADIINTVVLKRHKALSKSKKLIKENFGVGDTVTVYVRVREGEKERLQAFKGVVTKVAGAAFNRKFTVRKMSAGVGVERTFPLYCPSVDEVSVETKGNVRRARLYYLRSLKGKAARIDSELVAGLGIKESEEAAETQQQESTPAANATEKQSEEKAKKE
jgi:large subunit ribosomal protein L19